MIDKFELNEQFVHVGVRRPPMFEAISKVTGIPVADLKQLHELENEDGELDGNRERVVSPLPSKTLSSEDFRRDKS